MNSKLESLLQAISLSKGIVMLIGPTDCGKTTTAKYLLSKLCSHHSNIGFIDSDVGQSTLGPPGTIGAATFSCFNPQKNLELQAKNLKLAFIGAFSPIGHIMDLILGLKKMVDYLSQLNCEIVLIDTTGFVQGKAGLYLKKSKIELIKPDHLILFQMNNELQTLFDLCTNNHKHLVSVSNSVKKRSLEQRRIYRDTKISAYFKNCNLQTIPFPPLIHWKKDIITSSFLSRAEIDQLEFILQRKIYFAAITHRILLIASDFWFHCNNVQKIKELFPIEFIYILNKQYVITKYISLEAANNNLLALGVIKDINFKKHTFKILSPYVKSVNIYCMKLGATNLNI